MCPLSTDPREPTRAPHSASERSVSAYAEILYEILLCSQNGRGRLFRPPKYGKHYESYAERQKKVL